MTMWSQNMKAKQEAFQRAIDGLAAQSKATDEARRYENKGFQVTRRIIALSAIGAIIVWPKVVPVFWPDLPVIVGWTEWNPGFLFFSEGTEDTVWKNMKGSGTDPAGHTSGLSYCRALLRRVHGEERQVV